MADKRIIELTNERLILGDGDYIIIDSNEGTFKYKLKRIIDAIPALDDSLSHEGEAADAKAVGDALANVNVDTVNSSRQLLSEKYLLDQEPYLFRASGGDGSDRVEECIVGGSVAWNQLERNGNMWASGGITTTITIDAGNNTVIVTPGSYLSNYVQPNALNIRLINGHKYLYTFTSKWTLINGKELVNGNSQLVLIKSGVQQRVYINNSNGINAGIFSMAGITDDYYAIQYQLYTNAVLEEGDSLVLSNCMLIDLTAMFGSTIADYIYSLEQATAGAGVSWFKKYFPDDYYEYSAPTLKHVEGVSAKEVVGWNQWDEEVESGFINNSGQNEDNTSYFRSKNYIPVIPGATYYNKCPTTYSNFARFRYYDKNKQFVMQFGTSTLLNNTFIVPENAYYLRFTTGEKIGTGVTYNHDICINLSDPTKNGQYEPYRKNIYPLDSSLTLRGVPKLTDGKMWFDGDKYNADGSVQRRYGIVDLGTLGWAYESVAAERNGFKALLSGMKYSSEVPNIKCSKYITHMLGDLFPHSSTIDGITTATNSSTVLVFDSNYTDAATFKAAMSGVYLVYELVTPTTEQATPYTALQTLDPHGTEEFVSTGIVPVGHYSKYLENLRSKIEGLPKDFSTLIAPTEKAYKATQNYTVGSLLIVDNILYKVTSAIANGGTITPNTNVTATTLAAVIAAL